MSSSDIRESRNDHEETRPEVSKAVDIKGRELWFSNVQPSEATDIHKVSTLSQRRAYSDLGNDNRRLATIDLDSGHTYSNDPSSSSKPSHGPLVVESATLHDVLDDDSDASRSLHFGQYKCPAEFMRNFAHQLANDVKNEHTEVSNTGRISHSVLSDILEVFSGRLCEECSDKFGKEISVTINSLKYYIVAIVTTDETPYVNNMKSEVPRAEEGLFVFTTAAYRWLLSEITLWRMLSCGGQNAMRKIGSEVVESLQSKGAHSLWSQEDSSTITRVVLSLNWELRDYIDHLGLSPVAPDIWDKILCLTGSWYEVQALSVADYVRQTWPKTRHHLLTFLSKLVSAPAGEECSYDLPGEPELTLTATARVVTIITITGGLYHVAEVVGQIAWLAATLQLSSRTDRVIRLIPYLLRDYKKGLAYSLHGHKPLKTEFFNLHTETSTMAFDDINGSCWTRLFSHSILVRDYPISRRAAPGTGLEISLKAMASLVGSTQIVRFQNRIVMKGFNLLLVVTAIENGVVLWHALESSYTDERISYFGPWIDKIAISYTTMPTLRALENARHIIGWCSKATDFCGHSKADLEILTSGLRPTPASICIDRLYIEAGFYVIGGANVRINQKEQPTRLGRGSDYPSLLNEMAKQFVAFYDVASCRAWLVDGASALLHLVRISLHLDETDPESNYDWEFDKTKLVDAWSDSTGRHAAKRTLRQWENLALPVYVKNQSGPTGAVVKEYSTFQDRVNKVLHSLEILVDLQAYSTSAEGIKIFQNLDFKKGICGFDILDFLAPLGPIGTRIKRFDSWGDGWMDLIPEIGVVTIFGKGFGELIQPDNPDVACPSWKTIPKGEDYLISTASTLKLVQERLERRYHVSEVGDLTGKISWRSPPHSLDPCKCLEQAGTGQQKACDPVQFMVSSSSLGRMASRKLTPVDINSLDVTGAVVFANLSLTGQRISAKKTKGDQCKTEDVTSSASNVVSGSLGTSTTSTNASATQQSESSATATDATELTEIRNDTTTPASVNREQSKGKGKMKKLKTAWEKFKKR